MDLQAGLPLLAAACVGSVTPFDVRTLSLALEPADHLSIRDARVRTGLAIAQLPPRQSSAAR